MNKKNARNSHDKPLKQDKQNLKEMQLNEKIKIKESGKKNASPLKEIQPTKSTSASASLETSQDQTLLKQTLLERAIEKRKLLDAQNQLPKESIQDNANSIQNNKHKSILNKSQKSHPESVPIKAQVSKQVYDSLNEAFIDTKTQFEQLLLTCNASEKQFDLLQVSCNKRIIGKYQP